MKYLKGGANAYMPKKSSRKSRSRSRTRRMSLNSLRPKKTLRKTRLRRTKSLPSKKKRNGVKFANKNYKFRFGELNNGTENYSEWSEKVNHKPLENCVPVNDTAVSLPGMYKIRTKKGQIAQFTDKIGSVNTCLPENPYLGKSDDDRWCCFKTLEEAQKNEHLALNVKSKLKKQQENIHREYIKSLPDYLQKNNVGSVAWSGSNKAKSKKEMRQNQTGPHLLCNPRDSGRMRNVNKCSTQMYPCYDPKDNKCYNIDGDVSLMPAVNVSNIGKNLRQSLKKNRHMGSKSEMPPYF